MTLIEQLDRIRERQGKEPIDATHISDDNPLADGNPANRLRDAAPVAPWEDFTSDDYDEPAQAPSPLIPRTALGPPIETKTDPFAVPQYRLVILDSFAEREGQKLELDERALNECHQIVLRAIERQAKLELKRIQASIQRRVRKKAKPKRKGAK